MNRLVRVFGHPVEGFLFKVKVEKTNPNAKKGGESTIVTFD